MIDIAPIKARLAAATPGPWERDADYPSRIVQSEAFATCKATWDAKPGDPLYDDGPEPDFEILDAPGPAMNKQGDFDLIAHAPTDLAALVAEVERLRTYNAELKAERARLHGDLVQMRAALSSVMGENSLALQHLNRRDRVSAERCLDRVSEVARATLGPESGNGAATPPA